jgi:exportin-2 (importin alpha re-exporter)
MLMAYLQFPLKISKTLRPGLVALADVLFPQNWRDLIQNLLAYAIQNNGAILAVLKLIQSISHKYSYEQRSDPLYEEIIIVCDEIHDFLIELMKNTVSKVMAGNASEFEVNILEILIKVFYNLNYQDLHPKFEDNLVDWMNYLKMTMSLNSSGSNSEHIFKCKGAALEVILLYSNKYKEDVKGIIQEFCQEIWQLCSNASEDSEFDDIVFNCLKFFKSLMLWPDMKSFFQ